VKYYECHVTFTGDGSAPENPKGWKFSRIDGDPTLGAGVKCYLTRHYPERLKLAQVQQHLEQAGRAVAAQGFRVLRLKVELVVYDVRL
jgi:hypothetical protein